MAAITKRHLSGSTNGLGIKPTGGTASANAVEVHTAVSGTTDFDEIWLWGTNHSAAPVTVTIEWGSATVIEGNIVVTIPAQQGLMQLVPGLILNNAKVVEAFASVVDDVLLFGFVNRIDY
tara:strand:- start:542 stop:901 length:360 start_codon:yes stop_codon:yes gene_type:complete